MTVKYLFTALALLFAVFTASADPATEQLSAQLANMQAFKTDFTQKITDEKGELLQEASGELIIQRPRKLYWSTQQPYQHLVVTDGKVLWIYDIDLEQVSRQPFSDDLDQAPALLLSGEIEQISKHYAVSTSMVDNTLRFELHPKKSGSVFQRMTVDFNNKKLLGMSLTDNFGQLTEIIFSKLELNPQIDPELFNFSPPEGLDVIIDEP
jgi:outer membrane lipoprotein carrier protein